MSVPSAKAPDSPMEASSPLSPTTVLRILITALLIFDLLSFGMVFVIIHALMWRPSSPEGPFFGIYPPLIAFALPFAIGLIGVFGSRTAYLLTL
jgi:hypothetical protein